MVLGLVGLQEKVDGLAWGDGDVVDLQGLRVGSIGANHCDLVTCDREEEDVLQRRVDDPEEVAFAVLHNQLERI